MPIPVGISASRGSAILGVNKYKSPLVAWIELMEQIKPGFAAANGYELPVRIPEWEEPLNPKMASIRWGHAFEDAICDLVGGITDRERFYSTDKHGFPMTCHIDGLKNGRVQENKTAFDMAFKMGWGEPGSDMVPEMYQTQIQQQLYLTGLQHGDFNVLVFPKSPAEWERMGYKIKSVEMDMMFKPDGKMFSISKFAMQLRDLGYFHKFHVESNPATQKSMIENYKLFWNDNVLKEVPPPVNGYDDIKWLIAAPEGEIEASPEMKELWSEYVDIDNEIESMVERKKEIKNNFAGWVQNEIQSKNIKPGNEKRKMNIYAGPRKLFSITRAEEKMKIVSNMVDNMKENDPDIYEEMKTITFMDIMYDELTFTEKQTEKIEKADNGMENMYSAFRTKLIESVEKTKIKLDAKDDKSGVKVCEQLIGKIMKESGLPKEFEDRIKAAKGFKLTKLLQKDSVLKALEKTKPEIIKNCFERGIVEMSDPKSSLRISKPEKE